MILSQYSIALIAGYAAIVLGLAFWAHKQQNYKGYIIGNRELGWFTTTCSMLAGQFNGGGVFLIFTLGLMVGYGMIWFGLGFVAGYVVLALLAKKVHAEGQVYGDVNVPDIIERRIGNLTKHFSSFIVIGKALLFGTAQLLIAGTVIATIIGISNVWGIWLTALLIGIYVWMGGYLTVVKTDILQWCIMFGVAAFIAFLVPMPELSTVISEFQETPEMLKWGFGLFTFTLIISNADPWQRIQSAKTGDIAQKSLIISSLIFMLFIFLCVMVVKGSGLEFEKGLTFFSLFKEQVMPPFVLSVLGVFTLIAVMSTIDTQVQLFTSTLTKNVLSVNIKNDRDRFISVSRLSTALLLGSMALAASLVGNSMEFILKAFSFAYILAPVLIVSMVWGDKGSKFKDVSCLVALSLGLAVYIYMFFNGHFTQMINNVIPAGVTLVICLLGVISKKIFIREKNT